MIRMLVAAAVLASPLPVMFGLDRTSAPASAQGAEPAMIGTEKPVMLGRMVVTATALD